MQGLLNGIRVLDLSKYVAGPFCTAYFADLGADVIRIEPPKGGVDRYAGPLTPSGYQLRFVIANRNKTGITLDMNKAAGMELFHRLVRKSDIVVENYSPPMKQVLGLTYETLRKLKKDIILVSLSAFGTDGPQGHRVGFDPTVQAEMGLMYMNGFPDTPPFRTQTPWLDQCTALNSVIGVLLALLHRSRTGEGQYIETALIDTAAFHMGMSAVFAELEVLGIPRTRIGNASYYSYGDTYATNDGWVMITVSGDSVWRRFTTAIGRPELADDPRLQDDSSRYLNRNVFEPWVIDWARSRSAAEIKAAMEAARVPCSRVATEPSEASKNEQVQARQMFRTLDVDEVGPVAHPRLPFRMNRTQSAIEQPAPKLGEHNREVYSGLLGLSETELASLRSQQVI